MKKMAGIVALFALLITATGAFLGSSDLESELYNQTRHFVYRLVTPSNQARGGTGFILKDSQGRRVMVSNRHVCLLAEGGVMAAEQEGELQAVRVLSMTDSTDLCLLQAPKGSGGLEMAEYVQLYDRIFIVGHPYLNPISMSSGHYNYLNWVTIDYCYSGGPRVFRPFDDEPPATASCLKQVYAFFTDALAAPGNSGSPVIGTDGKVVGVVFAGGPALGLVIPLMDLKGFVDGE